MWRPLLANRKRALRGRADRDVVEGAAVGGAVGVTEATGMAAASPTFLRWQCEPEAIVLNGR
jgi:hypothetical protein